MKAETKMTPQGIMYGVQTAFDLIQKEVELLDKRHSELDKVDADTLSFYFFQRCMIGQKIIFCKNSVDLVFQTINTKEKYQEDSNRVFSISEELMKLLEKNDERSREVAIKMTSKVEEEYKKSRKNIVH